MNLDQINASRRERYANDPEYKAKVKIWAREAYLKRREDPDWVEEERTRNRIKMRQYLADPIKKAEITEKSLGRARLARQDPVKGAPVREKEREAHKKNPYKKMLAGAKMRARNRGVPCTLTQATIPRIPE